MITSYRKASGFSVTTRNIWLRPGWSTSWHTAASRQESLSSPLIHLDSWTNQSINNTKLC